MSFRRIFPCARICTDPLRASKASPWSVFRALSEGSRSSSGLSHPSGRMSASERLSHRRSKVPAILVERNRKVAPHAPHHNPDQTRRVAEAICAGLRHEWQLVGVHVANNSGVSPRARCLPRAKPAARKIRSFEPDHEIGTTPHQTPDETCAEILDHQDNWRLIDSEVKRRNP